MQLLKIHPEFRESTTQEQIDAKTNNTPLGMSVVMIRGEHCTGIQQMQSGLGILVIFMITIQFHHVMSTNYHEKLLCALNFLSIRVN